MFSANSVRVTMREASQVKDDSFMWCAHPRSCGAPILVHVVPQSSPNSWYFFPHMAFTAVMIAQLM